MPTRQTTDTVNRDLISLRIGVVEDDGASTLKQRAHIEVNVAFDRSPAPPGTDGRFFHTRTLKLTDTGDGPTRQVDGAPAASLTDAGPAGALSNAERNSLWQLLAKVALLAEELDGFA